MNSRQGVSEERFAVWIKSLFAHRKSESPGLVTVVVTSCGRYDLLRQTLDSFCAFNGFPIDRTIVVEDGNEIPDSLKERYGKPIDWLCTRRRVGQIAAIDYAYSRVSTPYIFHMEDDWEFFRPDFIERSLAVLANNSDCLQVWIRALSDTQRHPIEPQALLDQGVAWRRLMCDYDLNGWKWHGFSFNPGLRRLSDYVAIGGYGKHARFDFSRPWSAEHAIGEIYRERGFFAAILSDADGLGYVRHIGRDRRVAPPASTVAVPQ